MEEKQGRNKALQLFFLLITCAIVIELGISNSYFYFFNNMNELLEEPPEYLEDAKVNISTTETMDILGCSLLETPKEEQNMTGTNFLEVIKTSQSGEQIGEVSEISVLENISHHIQSADQKRTLKENEPEGNLDILNIEVTSPKKEESENQGPLFTKGETNIQISVSQEATHKEHEAHEKETPFTVAMRNQETDTHSAVLHVEETDHFLDNGMQQFERKKKANVVRGDVGSRYHPLLHVDFNTDKKNFTEADNACRTKQEAGRLMVFYNRREEASLISQLENQSKQYFQQCPQIFIGYRSVPLKKWTVPPRSLPILPLEYLTDHSLELNPGIHSVDKNCATIQYFEKKGEFRVKSVRCSGGRYHCYMCEIPVSSSVIEGSDHEWCDSSTCYSIRSNPRVYSTANTYIRYCRKSKGRLALIANRIVSWQMKKKIRKLRYDHRFRCRTEKILVYNVNPTMLFETIREEPMEYRPNRIEYGLSIGNCLSISRELNFTWVYTSCSQEFCYLCRNDDFNPPPRPEPDFPLVSKNARPKTRTRMTRLYLSPAQYEEPVAQDIDWMQADEPLNKGLAISQERDEYYINPEKIYVPEDRDIKRRK